MLHGSVGISLESRLNFPEHANLIQLVLHFRNKQSRIWILLLFLTLSVRIPLPSGIGGNLQAIAAQLHAAPVTSSFLARVEEMKHTLTALANSAAVGLGEQVGGAMRQRCKQIFRLPHLER